MEKVHKDFFYKNAGFVRGRYNLCRIWVESGYKLGILCNFSPMVLLIFCNRHCR